MTDLSLTSNYNIVIFDVRYIKMRIDWLMTDTESLFL